MRNKKEAIGLACQLAYEYTNADWEHIDDMLSTYEPKEQPCTGDELYDLLTKAKQLNSQGIEFDEAVKQMSSK